MVRFLLSLIPCNHRVLKLRPILFTCFTVLRAAPSSSSLSYYLVLVHQRFSSRLLQTRASAFILSSFSMCLQCSQSHLLKTQSGSFKGFSQDHKSSKWYRQDLSQGLPEFRASAVSLCHVPLGDWLYVWSKKELIIPR